MVAVDLWSSVVLHHVWTNLLPIGGSLLLLIAATLLIFYRSKSDSDHSSSHNEVPAINTLTVAVTVHTVIMNAPLHSVQLLGTVVLLATTKYMFLFMHVL